MTATKEQLRTKVCIIGSGPAGHTAAIYAARAGVIKLSGLQRSVLLVALNLPCASLANPICSEVAFHSTLDENHYTNYHSKIYTAVLILTVGFFYLQNCTL